jgi:isocitrate/isopropylmalate dehydrogenase
MAKYKIAWLPGDGIGNEVLEAAKIVLEKLNLDAEYIHGDIGWEYWCKEGDAFPQRTIDLLNSVDSENAPVLRPLQLYAPVPGISRQPA